MHVVCCQRLLFEAEEYSPVCSLRSCGDGGGEQCCCARRCARLFEPCAQLFSVDNPEVGVLGRTVILSAVRETAV